MFHPGGTTCLKSELSLFSLPPVQLSIASHHYEEFRPLATLAPGQAIEFTVPSSEDYLDLANVYLYVTAKVQKSLTEKLDADSNDKVYPNNLFLHALFSQLDVQLNGKTLSSGNEFYHYKTYLQCLLSYGTDAKQSQLTASLWLPEADRKAACRDSASIAMFGKVHADVCLQEKLLLPQVECKFRFIPSPDKFCLDVTGEGIQAKLEPVVLITSASLFVRKVKPAPSLALAHEQTLSKRKPAFYSFTRTNMRVHTIVKGTTSTQLDNCFQGVLPSRLVMVLVNHEAFTGSYASSPFVFGHFNLTSVSLFRNGDLVNGKPLNTNFTTKDYVCAYAQLFMGLDIPFHNAGNCISYKNYGDGQTVFAWDLSADGCANDPNHVFLSENGTLHLELTFASALDNNISVILYGENPAVFQIDQFRNVTSAT